MRGARPRALFLRTSFLGVVLVPIGVSAALAHARGTIAVTILLRHRRGNQPQKLYFINLIKEMREKHNFHLSR